MSSCQSSPRCPSLSCPCAFARAFVQLSARAALLLTSGSQSKPYLFLKTQMKCWRWAFSVTPEFCASKDGLKLGEVPGTVDNTISILDLNTDLYWLMVQKV